MQKVHPYIHYPEYGISAPKLLDRERNNDTELQRWRGIFSVFSGRKARHLYNLPVIIEHRISLNNPEQTTTMYYFETEPNNSFHTFKELTDYYSKEIQ